MFFELHNEMKIGYKKLSDSDLGLSPSSHQTHIGLSENVLTFLPDRNVVSEDSIFIYKDRFDYIDAFFDRIETPNGTFRSPKIKIGDKGGVSIVSTIRGIVGNNLQNLSWYLVWFGLKNEKLVFYLFNEYSSEYNELVALGLNFNSRGTIYIDNKNQNCSKLVNFIENKINSNAEDILKDLEKRVQIGKVEPDRRFQTYDIQKANQLNEELGRDGENLIAKYLSRLVKENKIKSFVWVNERAESGLPYDFHIQDNLDNITYLDVKTTGFDFDQVMVFSSQELNFILEKKSYSIFRVYKNKESQYFLRICNDCLSLVESIQQKTQEYMNSLSEIPVTMQSSKITISPKLPMLNFGKEQLLKR
ncbi:TPA: DUF3883 domain-containing protein [Streptococcus suis]|nr:DUF3883 domain-containing protein [Streptococcus suis]HEM3631538.1 DUF3883 domain-containing protein [Streptococcus suis]HEM3644619.1 DUF3883 domain-containing protein [Streptococcus suis]